MVTKAEVVWQDEAGRLAAALAEIAACNFRGELEAIGIARRALADTLCPTPDSAGRYYRADDPARPF